MITIQRLTSSELDLAKALFLFFQIDDGVKNPSVPSDEYVAALLRKEDFHVIIAHETGKLAGGLTAYELPMYKKETREMFLFEIAVLPEYRQQGIGKQLIQDLIDLCKEKNIATMFVATEEDNLPAQGLYTRTGSRADKVFMFEYVM